MRTGDDVISSLEKLGVILGKLDRRVLLGQSPSGSQSGIKNKLRLYISWGMWLCHSYDKKSVYN